MIRDSGTGLGPYLGDRMGDESLLLIPQTTLLADSPGEADKTDFSWGYYFVNAELLKDGFSPDYQFDRVDLMLQAVIGDMGVGLVRTRVVERDVESE